VKEDERGEDVANMGRREMHIGFWWEGRKEGEH
jgi:hypothetical protein